MCGDANTRAMAEPRNLSPHFGHSIRSKSTRLTRSGVIVNRRVQTSELPAVLFDLDGTLIDSVYQHVQAWHETLRDAGIATLIWKIHRRVG